MLVHTSSCRPSARILCSFMAWSAVVQVDVWGRSWTPLSVRDGPKRDQVSPSGPNISTWHVPLTGHCPPPSKYLPDTSLWVVAHLKRRVYTRSRWWIWFFSIQINTNGFYWFMFWNSIQIFQKILNHLHQSEINYQVQRTNTDYKYDSWGVPEEQNPTHQHTSAHASAFLRRASLVLTLWSCRLLVYWYKLAGRRLSGEQRA